MPSSVLFEVKKDSAIRQLKDIRNSIRFPALMDRTKYSTDWMTLMAVVLSARTKDSVTEEATKRLFLKFSSLEKLAAGDIKDITSLIYPVNFYKNKAKKLISLSQILIEKYKGKPPLYFKELISLPGVGRKSANLYLSLKGKPSITVDTHVHRIANRIPWVDTNKPEDTEKVLKEIFPRDMWINVSKFLVPFGQQICRPRSPKCFLCPYSVRNSCLYRKCVGILREISQIKKDKKVAALVEKRIREFSRTFKSGERRWFVEATFCILTANTSAKMGTRAIDAIKEDMFEKDAKVLEKKLRAVGYRFPSSRARYIVENRKFLGRLKRTIISFKDPYSRREWVVKNIKGLGYKESSHFFRNVGYKDFAILDFHILDYLRRKGVINPIRKGALSRKKYLQIEKIMNKISKWSNTDLSRLDLYLWYMETGEVLR